MTKLGKYEIKRELGRGAMGIVYEGFDPLIQRTVAIKTIQKNLIDESEAQEALNRFRREAQAAGRLMHPNIVAVYEYGEEGDMAFIAMEFISGRELKDYFDKEERFAVKDCVHIMLQLLEALEYSHEHGVVHRDIKPSNIIITKSNHIKVVDFGIARLESSELTQAGTVLGTPAYMSPEQFRGLTVDARSDIYSTGVILYQFLAGERPFSGNPTSLMHKVLTQTPITPSELNPLLPKALDAVVLKAMAKHPDERYQSAAEFKRALSRAAGFAVSSSGQMIDTDATLLVLKTGNQQPTASVDADATRIAPQVQAPKTEEASAPAISFDLSALSTSIEKNLQQAKASTNGETHSAALTGYEPTLLVKPGAAQVQPAAPDEGSSLLAGLAREAAGKQELKPAAQQDMSRTAPHDARSMRLHDTLRRISGFLESLAQHVRKAQPPISRSYNFGRRAVFDQLVCKGALSDSRRQNLSETALLDYVFLSINLSAPEPVALTRPRDMLDFLKDQLGKVKLRALDDLEALKSGKSDEWVKVRLAPDFPVQIQFKANYEQNRIDVQTLNLDGFGTIAFTLEPADVTREVMDGIGFYLLGRNEKLPEALKRA